MPLSTYWVVGGLFNYCHIAVAAEAAAVASICKGKVFDALLRRWRTEKQESCDVVSGRDAGVDLCYRNSQVKVEIIYAPKERKIDCKVSKIPFSFSFSLSWEKVQLWKRKKEKSSRGYPFFFSSLYVPHAKLPPKWCPTVPMCGSYPASRMSLSFSCPFFCLGALCNLYTRLPLIYLSIWWWWWWWWSWMTSN